MVTEVEARLRPVIHRYFDAASLTSVSQVTGGASQQTFRLTLLDASGREQVCAFRRAHPSLVSSTYGQLLPSVEAELLSIAAEAAIPVPEIYYVLRPEDQLGDGYIMAWLEGETLGQRIVKSPKLSGARELLAYQCGQSLAKIHSLTVPQQLQQKLGKVSPEALVRDTWLAYQALKTPQPMIDFTAQWLLSHLPDPRPYALVHGDFRNGNLMVAQTGIVAVLDWELCHLGDPMRDLGWLCVNSWRFGRSDLPIGGFGRTADLIDGYESIAGKRVDRSALVFWEVFGSFWWSVTTLSMAETWRTGETPSVERPVIGRRSSEAQMDCVRLLLPGTTRPTVAARENDNIPNVRELVTSVKTHLDETVREQLTGADRFLLRVAVNALSMVERELTLGKEVEAVELSGLQALLGQGDLQSLRWGLVHAIRAGQRLNEVSLHDHLRQTVAHRLAIDQPTYSAINDPEG